MKSDTVYKRAFNRFSEMLANDALGSALPGENELRRRLGVSRTTVRKVLKELARRSALVNRNGVRVLNRKLGVDEYYPDAETLPRHEQVEKQFMEWMLRGDARPGNLINSLDLARQFGVPTSAVREFLIRFSRFGLIEKRPNSGWLFKGFTKEFALELFEIRMMFELRSARLFADQRGDSVVWSQLRLLREEHEQLLKQIENNFHDFSALDNEFHRLINRVLPNRFIEDFYDVITVIFHYHYQWSKTDEKERNRAAVLQHLDYIEALFSRDVAKIEEACIVHLASARETLIGSLIA